ncbi:MAG: DUF2934 domain-containing protein [Rhodospirillales bacterium]
MTSSFSELTQDIQDRIREIAYLMWESAGRQHGMAMEYWLSAEQEVLSTLQAAAARMMPDPHPKSASAQMNERATSSPPPPAVDAPADTPPAAPALATPSAKPVRRTRAKAKA